MTAPRPDPLQQPDIRASGLDVDVLIVGAGISGIGAGIELVRRGQSSFVLLESRNDLGGTWRDNTYPGVSGAKAPSTSDARSDAKDAGWVGVPARRGV